MVIRTVLVSTMLMGLSSLPIAYQGSHRSEATVAAESSNACLRTERLPLIDATMAFSLGVARGVLCAPAVPAVPTVAKEAA